MPDLLDEGLGTLAPTVTHRDVQLCRVGVWNASTGQAPITQADLESMVRAGQDPQVDTAALFVGHFDQRTRHLADGEPALGWVKPTRVVDGVLYGDLEDVPAKFAAVMTKAYRRRSIEVKFDRAPGAQYPAVLTGLALLGVKAPAVKGLADVISRYSQATVPFDHVPSEAFEVEDAALSSSDTPNGDVPSTPAATASPDMGGTPARPGGQLVPTPAQNLRTMFGLADGVDVTQLQQNLMAALSGDSGKDKDKDNPGPNADGSITPKPAEQLVVQPAAGAGAPASLEGVGQGTPRRQFTPEELEQAREQLAAQTAVATPSGAGGKDLSPAELQATGEHGQIQPGNPDKLSAGVVTLSAGQYAELQAGAQSGLNAARQLDAQRRDGIIHAALAEGQLSVAEAAATWRPALDRDEAGTVALLSSLSKGRVPTVAVGHGQQAPADEAARQAQDAAFSAWEQDLFGADIYRPAPQA